MEHFSLPDPHLTPASSPCPQFSIPHPLFPHSPMLLSDPVQLTSSNHIGSEPCPNPAQQTAVPESPSPS